MQLLRLKKIKTVFAAVFLFFILFSMAFAAKSANHQCSGEDCIICVVNQTVEENLVLLKISAVFSAAFSCLKFSSKTVSIKSKTGKEFYSTLISQKIRINN